MAPKLLQLVPVGNPPLALFKQLDEALAPLGVTGAQGQAQLPAPTYAFNKDRKQYHSNAILRRLGASLEAGHQFVFGLTEVDLFVPDAPYVFGEADRAVKAALVSIARLKEHADAELLKRRVQREVMHQTGHLLGLSYCEDPRCAMSLASTLADCDRKNLALCNLCRNELAKLSR